MIMRCSCLPGGITRRLFTLAVDFPPGLSRYVVTVAVKSRRRWRTGAGGWGGGGDLGLAEPCPSHGTPVINADGSMGCPEPHHHGLAGTGDVGQVRKPRRRRPGPRLVIEWTANLSQAAASPPLSTSANQRNAAAACRVGAQPSPAHTARPRGTSPRAHGGPACQVPAGVNTPTAGSGRTPTFHQHADRRQPNLTNPHH
jgi:hypothetical protein